MLNGRQLYDQIVDKGLEIGHWQSDLYVKITPEATEIVNQYEFPNNVTVFKNSQDQSEWYDIPFCYAPFWDNRKPPFAVKGWPESSKA